MEEREREREREALVSANRRQVNVDQEEGAEETIWVDDQTLTVDYCDVEGGEAGVGGNGSVTWGDHNIVLPPLFESSNDFHLEIDSPCREKGSTTLLPEDTFDLNGNADLDETIPFDLDNRRRVVGASVDMGAYEFVCPGDGNGDGVVDFNDILAWLDGWGDCPEPPEPCPADLDGNGIVEFDDLLPVLSNWGCGEPDAGPSLSTIIVGMGLEWPDDWNDFLGWMGGTTAERENAACWMDHYYWAHFLEVCLCSPSCPDDDPWGGHHSF